MTHRLSSLSFVALAACFGSGPVPTMPTGATVMFTAPVPEDNNACNSSVYISAVELGATAGYAVTLPYLPNDNCNNTTGAMGPMTVSQFPKDGSSPQGTSLGGATSANNGAMLPVMATDGSNVVFAYTNNGPTTLGPAMAMLQFSGPNANVVALALDDTTIYGAAVSMTTGSDDPYSPTWPCNGCMSSGTQSGGLFSLVPPTGPTTVTATAIPSSSNPTFACSELKHCLVANTNTLYVMTAGDPTIPTTATIASAAKPSGPLDLTFDSIPLGPNPPVPVGFAANDARLAWATANPPSSSNNSPLTPGCSIWSRTPTGPAATMVFHTTSFSCMDTALDADGSHIYFAIVSSTPEDCSGCNDPVHGDGIGRITADGVTFESLDLGVNGDDTGPRRVYIDGDTPGTDTMFVVDPFTVAAIATSALDGKHDFSQ